MPFYNQQRIGGAMDADHIYYNLTISNYFDSVEIDNKGDPIPIDTTATSVPVTFLQNRAQPYLINPSDYFLSVQRLTLDNTSTPLFIAQPILGSTGADVNNTIYSISIVSNTGTIQTVPIIWQPQDGSIQVPSGPITQQDLTNNPYYYCYSYDWFIKCINDSIANIPNLAYRPSLSFDARTGLFTIQANVVQYRTNIYGQLLGTGTGTSTPQYVFMNTALFNLFASFNFIYYGGLGGGIANVPVGAGLDYQILFPINGKLTATPIPYITNVVTNTYVSPNENDVYNIQEYNSLALWCPIKSIVVRGSLLNVVSELIATPVVYQNGQNINAGKQNTDVLPIFVEFSIPFKYGTEYKPFIYFEPTGEYRLADLYSDIELDGLQFDIFWKDSFGVLHPFLLSLGSKATMKLLFRKKSFNSDKI